MAITKERKQEMLAEYRAWIARSQAMILVEYSGARMKDLDGIRARVREAGGEFHVVKNTLVRRAFTESGLAVPPDYLEKSTAVAFAFADPVTTAKALAEASKGLDFIRVKGGFMGRQVLSLQQIKALAELPPLPVVQAQLLGVLQAPAGKLVRTIAEPARALASVFRAYAEKAQATA